MPIRATLPIYFLVSPFLGISIYGLLSEQTKKQTEVSGFSFIKMVLQVTVTLSQRRFRNAGVVDGPTDQPFYSVPYTLQQ